MAESLLAKGVCKIIRWIILFLSVRYLFVRGSDIGSLEDLACSSLRPLRETLDSGAAWMPTRLCLLLSCRDQGLHIFVCPGGLMGMFSWRWPCGFRRFVHHGFYNTVLKGFSHLKAQRNSVGKRITVLSAPVCFGTGQGLAAFDADRPVDGRSTAVSLKSLKIDEFSKHRRLIR